MPRMNRLEKHLHRPDGTVYVSEWILPHVGPLLPTSVPGQHPGVTPKSFEQTASGFEGLRSLGSEHMNWSQLPVLDSDRIDGNSLDKPCHDLVPGWFRCQRHLPWTSASFRQGATEADENRCGFMPKPSLNWLKSWYQNARRIPRTSTSNGSLGWRNALVS